MTVKIGVFFFALIVGIAGMVAPAMAATEEEIQASIVNGTAWLAANQNPDGSWGSGNVIAETGLVLYKLIDRAIELGKDPIEVCNPVPSTTCYEYAQNVKDGLNFTMTNVETRKITPQDHTSGATGTIDDPDTNGNGIGLAWESAVCGIIPCGDRESYTTGIITGSLSLLDGTETVAVGPYAGTAYSAIVQDAVDWLSYAQSDVTVLGSAEGGWEYSGRDNSSGGDNSVTGYAVLGLAEAEAAGYNVPGWVKTELSVWIDYIQTDADVPGCDFGGGSDCDGGSGYWQPGSWVNILKTGNLIEEMTLYGDSKTAPRLVNATDYITRHFFDPNIEPGWGYSLNPANYQAMFTTMKGLEYAGIDLLDINNDGTPEFDWWLNFTDVIVSQEIPSVPGQGYWTGCYWGDQYLCTTWALLTLEKTAPPAPQIIEGRMTGGGSIFTEKGMRVTHGFELHCNASKAPNNLQINWGKKDKFHLESLTEASCRDNPNIDEAPPVAGFDTYEGKGTGRYNGASATAHWIFADAGEPGKDDTALIQVWDAGGNLVLEVSGNLNNGNNQAHEENP